ncbi:MAG: hypothetical protein Kow0063_09090 [Anaerolineae bacterium]
MTDNEKTSRTSRFDVVDCSSHRLWGRASGEGCNHPRGWAGSRRSEPDPDCPGHPHPSSTTSYPYPNTTYSYAGDGTDGRAENA